MAHIAETRYGLEPEAVLDNIIYCRCYTHEQQMERVMQIPDVVVDDESPFRVVVCALLDSLCRLSHLSALCLHGVVTPGRLQIVDSITALFRADFSGRGELADRQQKLNQHMSALKKIAEDLNIAVLIVNQGKARLNLKLAVSLRLGLQNLNPVTYHVSCPYIRINK